jgi:hypothetical protein
MPDQPASLNIAGTIQFEMDSLWHGTGCGVLSAGSHFGSSSCASLLRGASLDQLLPL